MTKQSRPYQEVNEITTRISLRRECFYYDCIATTTISSLQQYSQQYSILTTIISSRQQ